MNNQELNRDRVTRSFQWREVGRQPFVGKTVVASHSGQRAQSSSVSRAPTD